MLPEGDPVPLQRYVIPTVRNASRIMQLLATSPGGCRATDLSRSLGIPETTTLRIMATLQLEGLACKVRRRFLLGPKFAQLGDASRQHTALLAARPGSFLNQGAHPRPVLRQNHAGVIG